MDENRVIEQSHYKMSATFTEFHKSLSNLQGVLESAKKSADNPFFSSRYADLKEVWAVLQKPLLDNGFSVLQIPYVDYSTSSEKTVFNKKTGSSYKVIVPMVYVHTRVTHSSGEFMEMSLSFTPSGDDPQSIGSTITYGRRYSLMPIFGVCPEDDDGNAGSSAPDQPNDIRARDKQIAEEVYKRKKEPIKQAPASARDDDYIYDSNGVARFQKKTQKLNDEYQRDNYLITTDDYIKMRECIEEKGILMPKFVLWLKKNYNVMWYDIKIENFDLIMSKICNNPGEINANSSSK